MLALLPAVCLALYPGVIDYNVEWILLGSGIELNGNNRWILLVSVMIWASSALIDKSHGEGFTHSSNSSFYFLAMGGQLAAILSTDLIGFFSAASLMGYAFYGFLNSSIEQQYRRYWNLYLVFLVVADLALFEAMIMAVSATEITRFNVLRWIISDTQNAQIYVWMTVTGFALKAGIWPAHRWIIAAYTGTPLSVKILLFGVPLMTALFGLLKWLPNWDNSLSIPGSVIMLWGLMTAIYALIKLLQNRQRVLIPLWLIFLVSGVFLSVIGAGFVVTQDWSDYKSYFFISLSLGGFSITALIIYLTIGQNQQHLSAPFSSAGQTEDTTQAQQRENKVLTLLSANYLVTRLQYLQVAAFQLVDVTRQRAVNQLNKIMDEPGWTVAITFFMLFILIIVSLSL